MPACEARIVQMPAATKVTVLPLTVQTGVVSDEKLTGSPDVAFAVSANGVPPSVLLAIDPKLIVWLIGAGVTVKLWSTLGAALYVALPACDARTVHVPTATKVTVLPLAVHTGTVSDAKLTASADDAVAPIENGAVPSGRSVKAPNVIVWVALATVKF